VRAAGARKIPDMRLKLLFGAVIVASLSAATSAQAMLPCPLSEEDFQSLAHAKAKPLLPADIEALSPSEQRDLCRARKFYREARGKDPQAYARTHTADDVPIQLARFTTSAEYDQVHAAGMAVMLPLIEGGAAPKAATKPSPQPPK
jgi:hypothetical protein